MDWFQKADDFFTNVAKDGIKTMEGLGEEVKRGLDKAIHEPEQIFNDITARVEEKAHDIERFVKAAIPNFGGKLQEVINDITKIASAAAEDGVDIIESINGAVEIVLQEVQKALEAAINAVNQLLHDAADRLYRILDEYSPEFLNHLLKRARDLIDWILGGLNSLAEGLKNGVTNVVETIKTTVQDLVKEIGEVVGPIWDCIKKLWKILFGAEPEQCQLTAQWFDERMKRAEKEMLSSGPLVVIRKRKYFELLPPAEDAWKAIISDFLDTSPVWGVYRARLMHLLTKPRDGHLVQCLMDEVYTDRLGGRQRVQINVLHYRWRTESFRKVSSGFLGILAMVSAIREEKKVSSANGTPKLREQPLEIDAATATKIYKIIEPHLWLRKVESAQIRTYAQDRKACVSQQIMSKDENGWRKAES